MRKAEFKKDLRVSDEPINDSRFGIRTVYQTPNEVPSIFSYANLGRGVQGEHQN